MALPLNTWPCVLSPGGAGEEEWPAVLGDCASPFHVYVNTAGWMRVWDFRDGASRATASTLRDIRQIGHMTCHTPHVRDNIATDVRLASRWRHHEDQAHEPRRVRLGCATLRRSDAAVTWSYSARAATDTRRESLSTSHEPASSAVPGRAAPADRDQAVGGGAVLSRTTIRVGTNVVPRSPCASPI